MRLEVREPGRAQRRHVVRPEQQRCARFPLEADPREEEHLDALARTLGHVHEYAFVMVRDQRVAP